ncbi:MAG: hypothetical protein DRJ09_06695 [Bacteroidetes bacterium]|nr:MAG: hypothetical protein DRJ09_06695 [Bacteroidota bacterium]
MGMKILLILTTIVLLLFGNSCRKDKLDGEVLNNPALVEELYSKAKDTVVFNNQHLVPETELYRDFFPGKPTSSKTNLQVLLWLISADSSSISGKYSVTKLYVINNNDVWISEPNERNDDYLPDYKSHYVSINGPQWNTGLKVDVVVAVSDISNSKELFMIARDQTIERIE